MEFKFDANQPHQTAAIESVCGLFVGQARVKVEMTFSLGSGFAAVPNRMDLDDDALLANLRAVQTENGLAPVDALEQIESTIKTEAGDVTFRFPNFSEEMETGTGKTYCYIRTALELSRRYGMRKFIIVVPSVAVREGVLKTLQVTEAHLKAQYDNLPYRYYVYDSANLSTVRQFALSDGVELLVMTIDSFTRASNIINQEANDRLAGETPIHLIQAARPVVILDEPQNMESEQRVQAIASLYPLMALRYSATHKNPYNTIYRLTPFDAYRQALVKRIEVASVVKEGSSGHMFLRLDGITANGSTVRARIAIHKRMAGGAIKEQVVTVKSGDSLEEKAARAEYAGYDVEEINPGGGFVRFGNSTELREGDGVGADKDTIFAAQIRYTVETHFRSQRRLRDRGIKVLSLFFIDKVDNYAPENSLLRRLFADAFNELKRLPENAPWRDLDPDRVQSAYFAQRNRKGGGVEYMESSGKTKEDEAAFNLIMRAKERLLSFEEPVSFIFSHSALREGWDSPNVFQICTLNQTISETKKRQEIGRGVRLAVDQTGERVQDRTVNVLTVVANESYELYVSRLQAEIEEEYGKEGVPPPPPNARERGEARLRKEFTLRPEFQSLWERIRPLTRYAVEIDTERLLADVLPEIDAIRVRPPRVTVTKVGVEVGEADGFSAQMLAAPRTLNDLSALEPRPNLVALMLDLMEHTMPPVRLTRRTLLEVLRRTQNQQAVLKNPQEWATEAVRLLKEKLADQLVAGIRYEPTGGEYRMSQFKNVIESWREYLVPAERSVYDHVIAESGPERDFTAGLEQRAWVKMYVKLPGWFTVSTPVGDYNPDWAIVAEREGGDDLYLIAETKSTKSLDDLRPDERRKIHCGRRHFEEALGTLYRRMTTAADLDLEATSDAE
ncbi:MAG: DEAD/DEAH box helicase family protein [Janthinobacterium lividum]